MVDGQGRPHHVLITGGQVADAKPALEVMKHIRAGQNFLADRAYDADAIRAFANARGATVTIPPKSYRKAAMLPFDKRSYAKRNVVERFFNKIKQYRGLATRYDKHAEQFMGGIILASIRIWLKSYESTA
ncbi:MAG: IS5 family transposase [Pseudomonadota bacterium]